MCWMLPAAQSGWPIQEKEKHMTHKILNIAPIITPEQLLYPALPISKETYLYPVYHLLVITALLEQLLQLPAQLLRGEQPLARGFRLLSQGILNLLQPNKAHGQEVRVPRE